MGQRIFTQSFAVVGAIVEKNGKILLVKENTPGPDFGTWNQPAGWLEPGDDPLLAVSDEVKEETGLDFMPQAILGVYSLVREDVSRAYGATPHAVKLIFRGKVSGGELIKHNEEISEVRWFEPAEISAMPVGTLRDLDIKREVEDYFAGKHYSLEMIRHTVQK